MLKFRVTNSTKARRAAEAQRKALEEKQFQLEWAWKPMAAMMNENQTDLVYWIPPLYSSNLVAAGLAPARRPSLTRSPLSRTSSLNRSSHHRPSLAPARRPSLTRSSFNRPYGGASVRKKRLAQRRPKMVQGPDPHMVGMHPHGGTVECQACEAEMAAAAAAAAASGQGGGGGTDTESDAPDPSMPGPGDGMPGPSHEYHQGYPPQHQEYPPQHPEYPPQHPPHPQHPPQHPQHPPQHPEYPPQHPQHPEYPPQHQEYPTPQPQEYPPQVQHQEYPAQPQEYPPQAPHQEYPPQAPHQEYPAQAPEYPPQAPHQEYPPQAPHQEYPAQAPHPEYPPQAPHPEYPPQHPQQQEFPPQHPEYQPQPQPQPQPQNYPPDYQPPRQDYPQPQPQEYQPPRQDYPPQHMEYPTQPQQEQMTQQQQEHQQQQQQQQQQHFQEHQQMYQQQTPTPPPPPQVPHDHPHNQLQQHIMPQHHPQHPMHHHHPQQQHMQHPHQKPMYHMQHNHPQHSHPQHPHPHGHPQHPHMQHQHAQHTHPHAMQHPHAHAQQHHHQYHRGQQQHGMHTICEERVGGGMSSPSPARQAAIARQRPFRRSTIKRRYVHEPDVVRRFSEPVNKPKSSAPTFLRFLEKMSHIHSVPVKAPESPKPKQKKSKPFFSRDKETRCYGSKKVKRPSIKVYNTPNRLSSRRSSRSQQSDDDQCIVVSLDPNAKPGVAGPPGDPNMKIPPGAASAKPRKSLSGETFEARHAHLQMVLRLLSQLYQDKVVHQDTEIKMLKSKMQTQEKHIKKMATLLLQLKDDVAKLKQQQPPSRGGEGMGEGGNKAPGKDVTTTTLLSIKVGDEGKSTIDV